MIRPNRWFLPHIIPIFVRMLGFYVGTLKHNEPMFKWKCLKLLFFDTIWSVITFKMVNVWLHINTLQLSRPFINIIQAWIPFLYLKKQ